MCYVIRVLYGIKSQNVDFRPIGMSKDRLAVRCWKVGFIVTRASNISSWIFWEYLPEFHSSDAQVEVNIKDLKESLARYPSIKGYAID